MLTSFITCYAVTFSSLGIRNERAIKKETLANMIMKTSNEIFLNIVDDGNWKLMKCYEMKGYK